MPDTVRERIFENLRTSLAAITIANGFDNDIASVRRYDINDDSLGPFPMIYITPSVEIGDDTAYPLIALDLNAILEVWIRPAKDETRYTDTILNSLLGDIKKKLNEDITRGGIAIDTIVGTSVEPFESMRGQSEAGYFVTVKIQYRHKQTDPKQAL